MNIAPNRLELHYHFNDDSHSMNAKIRNECEKELIHIFNEIIQIFELEVDIESEALREGGLREIWKFIGKNSQQLTLIVSICAIIISRIPLENDELVSLQIKNLKLENELKKLEIQKLKEEHDFSVESNMELQRQVLDSLNTYYKIVWHKSNFYKKINKYNKIEKITTSTLNDSDKPTEKPISVSKKDFSKFILHSNEFVPIVDEDAVIEIISPVLKSGNFQWKGFYNNEIIPFYVTDKKFRSSVKKKEIEFVNGVAIKCVLKQTRIIDDYGFIKVKKSEVLTVLEIIKDSTRMETEQGKKYRKEKELISDQLKFDLKNKKNDD